MPTDNEKMLQALVERKAPGTDNQNILKAYSHTNQIDEAASGALATGGIEPGGLRTGIGVAGGLAAAGGAALATGGLSLIPMAAAGLAGYAGTRGLTQGTTHNRVTQAALKFATGRGGGLSQLFGKAAGLLGGAAHDELKARHSIRDTAAYLWKNAQGLLSEFPQGLTGEQIRGYLSKVPMSEGGDKINPDKLPSTKLVDQVVEIGKGLVKDNVYNRQEIMQLFSIAAGEVYQIVKTGQAETAGKQISIGDLLEKLNNDPKSLALIMLNIHTNTAGTP